MDILKFFLFEYYPIALKEQMVCDFFAAQEFYLSPHSGQEHFERSETLVCLTQDNQPRAGINQ